MNTTPAQPRPIRRQATRTEYQQLHAALEAVRNEAGPMDFFNEGDLDRFCTGEQEMVRNMLLRWACKHAKEGPAAKIANDKATQWTLHRGEQALADWLMTCIVTNRADALRRMAQLVEVLHEGNQPFSGKYPRKVTAAKLGVKLPRGKGRPSSSTTSRSTAKMFATSIQRLLEKSYESGRLPSAQEVRRRVNAYRKATEPTWAAISDTEFARCVREFGLKGLLVTKAKKPGPKKGAKQSVRNHRSN